MSENSLLERSTVHPDACCQCSVVVIRWQAGPVAVDDNFFVHFASIEFSLQRCVPFQAEVDSRSRLRVRLGTIADEVQNLAKSGRLTNGHCSPV